MGYHKKENNQTSVHKEKEFSLDDRNDVFVIKGFEKDLNDCCNRSVNVFGKEISGFNLYLHENNLFVYSKQYPCGAIRNLEGYRYATKKMSALNELLYRREYMAKNELERINQLTI